MGGWDQEGHGFGPDEANTLQVSISKITREKWMRGVAHAVEHMLYKREVLSSSSSPPHPKNWKHIMYLLLLQWNKIKNKQQEELWKLYKCMKIKQYDTKWPTVQYRK
jgi:hypothetical protein